LRVREAAAYLGVTVNFIRDAVAKQTLPAMMLGHRLVLDVRDLDKFLDRMKHRCAA
jgi:excisionase family DNA binding protein